MKILFLICFMLSIHAFGQIKFKKSKIKIGDVKYEELIGEIAVNTDHSNQSSKLIKLPVHIIKSPNKITAEPIYWFEGGPGQSNMKYVPSQGLLENHDFVSIGYRGVDGSIKLKSKKVDKALKGLKNDLLSDESLDNVGQKLQKYSSKLINEGIDINHFTIMDVIDDFEAVRKELKHGRINILSASYGTRVALLYSYRFPEIINRSLMVGVNPPGHFVWYPEKTTRVIQTYDSIYKMQLKNDDISIEESINQAFEGMPKRWSLFKLDANKIKTSSFLLMFQKSTSIMVFDAYRKAALNGDYSGLYLMQLAFDYVGLFMKFTNGDLCSKAVSADYSSEIDYRKLLKPEKNEIGAPYSQLLWGISSNWPIKSIPAEFRTVQKCNTETLMVGGNLDISTPVEFATEELLPNMPNAKQIILKDMGHCGDLMWLQNKAFNHLCKYYFDEGKIDTTIFKTDPILFAPKKSFSKMAKVYYPFVLIFSIFK